MKRVLVMCVLLLAVISLALTRRLPIEGDLLMPYTSASPDYRPVPGELLIMSGQNRQDGMDIRVIKKGEEYVLQLRYGGAPSKEYGLKVADSGVFVQQ